MKGLIFTYALTYGGAVVSLFNPFNGLLIYICFAIIRPPELWYWSVPAGNYSRTIGIAFLAGWALNGFGNWKLGRALPMVICIAGYWLWAAISAANCLYFPVAASFLESSVKIVLPVIAGVTLIENTTQLRHLAWTILLSQGYVAFDLNMSYFSGLNRLELDGFGGGDNNTATIGLVTAIGLAGFVGLSEEVTWKKILALASAAFMIHCTFFSMSRGGMVALCALGLASFILIPKQPKYYALFALGAIVSVAMVGDEVLAEFSSSFEEEELDWSAESRFDLWRIAGQMTLAHPIVGVGPHHFSQHVHQYHLDGKPPFKRGKEAHSTWCQLAAEIGIPGVSFLFLFYALTMLLLYRRLRERVRSGAEEDQMANIARMVCASLVGFFVGAQFVTAEGLEIPYYIALLGLGALKLDSRVPTAEATSLD